MARVIALTRDLLFGSQLQGMLAAAGYDVELLGSPHAVAARLRELDAEPSPLVLVADLTDPELDAAGSARVLASGRERTLRTVAYYAHVDGAARARAERAGIETVVPRSRMAREGAAIVAQALERR